MSGLPALPSPARPPVVRHASPRGTRGSTRRRGDRGGGRAVRASAGRARANLRRARLGPRPRRAPAAWAEAHPFPTCVVCGPDRADDHAFRIFPGPVSGADGLHAATWTPSATLAGADGYVSPECVVGRPRLPHERARGQLRPGPPGGSGTAHRPAGLRGARGRAALGALLAVAPRRPQASLGLCAFRRGGPVDLRVAGAVDRVARDACPVLARSPISCAPRSHAPVLARSPIRLRLLAQARLPSHTVCMRVYDAVRERHRDGPPSHLSILRGHVRARGDDGGGRASRRCAATATTSSARVHLPQGHGPEGAARGSRPPHARRWCARDGELVEATWDEAFEEIDRRLAPILEKHGRNAVAVLRSATRTRTTSPS